ncbi:MAG: carboxylesterase family protein [Treponema sp.]|jgi:para-nitrobenzyl esterase|nr:carboxylesterase family protein [Treponema sp.]
MGLYQVETKYGALRGVQKIGYSVFRGIPYAEAPVGSLRWKKPLPPKRQEGLRDARVFPNQPLQEGNLPPSFYWKEFFADEDYFPAKSEDCLYLNVWTPAEKSDEKLPVAFWIHGGAFINGFSSEMEFDGAAFAARGVILVTVEYRLGAMGFLAHPWLSAEEGGSGNYGLYDCIAALDWVQENIAAFGGDPGRVTAFGQSAGAMIVQALVSSALTQGKIHRAIIQSGGGYRSFFNRYRRLADMEQTGAAFVNSFGAGSLGELRKIPGEDFIKIQMEFLNRSFAGGGLPFAPCIDGVILENDSDRLLESAAHLDIPYMIGCTGMDIGFDREQAAGGERPGLYRAGVDFSLLNEKLGRQPCCVYFFTHCPPGDDAGAFHSAELWYEFGTLDRSWRPKNDLDYVLSDRMIAYWTNFMKSGDPNGAGLLDWKPCREEDPFVMELT